jgi:hypothetical protein
MDNTLQIAIPTSSFAHKGRKGKAVPMVKHHNMKTSDGMEVKFHIFLSLH